MKRLSIAFLILIASFAGASAFPQGGITPCVMTAQPGDLAVTTGSANVHLNACGETLIVINNGATDARVRLGTSSVTTALATDLLIPKNTTQTFNVGTSGLWFAAISTGTTTLSFILGTAVQ